MSTPNTQEVREPSGPSGLVASFEDGAIIELTCTNHVITDDNLESYRQFLNENGYTKVTVNVEEKFEYMKTVLTELKNAFSSDKQVTDIVEMMINTIPIPQADLTTGVITTGPSSGTNINTTQLTIEMLVLQWKIMLKSISELTGLFIIDNTENTENNSINFYISDAIFGTDVLVEQLFANLSNFSQKVKSRDIKIIKIINNSAINSKILFSNMIEIIIQFYFNTDPVLQVINQITGTSSLPENTVESFTTAAVAAIAPITRDNALRTKLELYFNNKNLEFLQSIFEAKCGGPNFKEITVLCLKITDIFEQLNNGGFLFNQIENNIHTIDTIKLEINNALENMIKEVLEVLINIVSSKNCTFKSNFITFEPDLCVGSTEDVCGNECAECAVCPTSEASAVCPTIEPCNNDALTAVVVILVIGIAVLIILLRMKKLQWVNLDVN